MYGLGIKPVVERRKAYYHFSQFNDSINQSNQFSKQIQEWGKQFL